MQTINGIDELKLLSVKQKFYVLSHGNLQSYIFNSIHPLSDTLVVAIWSADYTTAKVFSKHSFSKNVAFLTGEYVSHEVGEIMKQQLNSNIESIEAIYLQKESA